MSLSPRAIEFLRKAGWSEDRRYPVDSIEQELAALGHVLLPPARAFLQRYGGLVCRKSNPYQTSTLAVDMDPVEFAGRLSVQELRQHEESVGARLSPLGEAGYGYYGMLMDENGRVFALDQEMKLHDWAENPDELIETLTFGL